MLTPIQPQFNPNLPQAGMYTDDCEMTVGLMHALVADDMAGNLTPDAMLSYWKREYDSARRHNLLSRPAILTAF